MSAERLHHLLRLVLAQQPVVDKHARELVADRLVHEQRGDRRIDAARQRAEDALAPDRSADPLHLLLDHSSGRPRRRRARDVVEKVLEEIGAVRRVHDFRVELHAVEAPLPILERRDRRRPRRCDDSRPGRRRSDGVAMRHPDRLLLGQACEQLGLDSGQLRLAELGRAGPLDRAPELQRQQLRAVADA
jgi:hypothetical protein